MKNLFNNGGDEPQGNSSQLLTAVMFFGKDGSVPYETPIKFLSFGEGLRPKEADDMRKVIDCLNAGMRMDGNPPTGVDAGARPYTFHRAFKAKAVLGFKIINGGGMPKLIQDYQDGKITIDFTLADLIEEARKS
jgi:hypothetical protein